MAFTFEDMLIDRPLEIIFRNSKGEILGGLNNIEGFSINQSSEKKDKTGADGSVIKSFFTSKTVEVSGESSLVSMSLIALQNGTTKISVTEDAPMLLPSIEKYAKGDSPITLKYKPDGEISVVGLTPSGVPDPALNYKLGEQAGEDTYAVAEVGDDKVAVTLPTNSAAYVQIVYNYSATSAVAVTNTSNSFPKTCEMLVKVLACNACDKETMRLVYIDFPAFQLSPDFDWTVDTESTQPFSGSASVDFCGGEQVLFTVSAAEDDIQ